jgi:hypothetical protein
MPRYLRRRAIARRATDGSGVLFDPEGSRILTVNAVALRVWELLDEHGTSEEIAGALQQEWGISQQQAQCDVDLFVADLHRRGWVDECDEPTATG